MSNGNDFVQTIVIQQVMEVFRHSFSRGRGVAAQRVTTVTARIPAKYARRWRLWSVPVRGSLRRERPMGLSGWEP